MSTNYESAVSEELSQINQSGSTGESYQQSNGTATASLSNYTNYIFGAPFQLLNSVDRRFSSVNSVLGTEYLRNVMLNSPILYIRPGLPLYTGGDETILDSAADIYNSVNSGNNSILGSVVSELAENTIFSAGSKIQRRMFGLRETYHDYMSHVNYMLRSVAVFLGITEASSVPSYTFTASGDPISFADASWENYRMLVNEEVEDAFTQLKNLAETTFIGSVGSAAVSTVSEIVSALTGNGFSIDNIMSSFDSFVDSTMLDAISARTTTVQFMVEPVALQESLTNTAEQSLVEQSIDAITNSIGYELAFITGSNADTGMIGNLTEFLGSSTETAMTSLNDLTSGITGGWINNIFNGGIRSISGQKMIYPKIYKSSSSSMSYEYSITLRSPYGDVYNYYMNIVVPLCHLIALAAPRMITSNSITSPYMVQAFIPGMSTCELGIISNMVIIKNPDANHVSVNGFPLTVKVTFTVQELYSSLSISPANDPSSYTHNETLNDYLCNLGGLVPSTETKAMQSANSSAQTSTYFSELGSTLAQMPVQYLSDTIIGGY